MAKGGMHGEGACLVKGVCMVKGVCVMNRVCVVKGACMTGGMRGRKVFHYSGRYKSYWNTFLFVLVLLNISMIPINLNIALIIKVFTAFPPFSALLGFFYSLSIVEISFLVNFFEMVQSLL